MPVAHRARVPECRAGELQRRGRRIGMRADVVPVEDVLAEGGVPPCGRGRESLAGEVLRGGIGVGVERGLAVPRIARPPADLDLLPASGVALYENVRWRGSAPPRGRSHSTS